MAASEIGQRVRELRRLVSLEREELSARELSRLAGLSHSVVGQLEAGDIQDLRSTSLAAVARTLGAELSYLATGDGQAPAVEVINAAVAAARSNAAA